MKVRISLSIDKLMTWLLMLMILFMQIQVSSTCTLIGIGIISFLQCIRKASGIYPKTDYAMLVVSILFFMCIMMMYINSSPEENETKLEMLSLVGLFIIIFVSSFGNAINEKAIISFLFWSAALLSLLGMCQYLFNIDVAFFRPLLVDRLQCGYNGPNELANANVIIIGIAFMYHIFQERIKHIFLGSVPIIGAIIFSWSRGGFIILSIVLFCILLAFLFKTNFNGRNVLIKKLMLLFLGSCIVMFFLNYYLPNLRMLRAGSTDRQYLLEYTFRIFKEAPIFGHGLGYTASSFSIMNNTPHNEYFLFAINGGIIGLAVLSLLFGVVLIKAYKKRKYHIMFGFIVFFLVEATFNNLIRFKVAILFYVLVFMLFSVPEKELQMNRELLLGR